MTDRLDPDLLSAYLDGALDADAAKAVEAHLAVHPEDRALLEAMRRADAALQEAFPPSEARPVPDGLAQTLGLATKPAVIPLRPRPRLMPRLAAGAVLAAGLALAVYLVPGTNAPGPSAPGPRHLSLGPVAASAPLTEALATMRSGDRREMPDGTALVMVASFAVTSGGLCREFYLYGQTDGFFDHALACDGPDGWSVRVATAERGAETAESFQPAGGEGDGAIAAMLDALGAGLMLTAEEEAARLGLGEG